MKNKRSRHVAIVLALTLIMSMLGVEGAFAVSKPGSTKITSLKASGNYVTVKWKKASRASGYVLYCNGKKIVRTSKKSYKHKLSYRDTYTYQVIAFKKYKVKRTKYFNKKTDKWQTNKIKGAKKKVVKVTKYKYGKYSKSKSIKAGKDIGSAEEVRASLLDSINNERTKAGLEPLTMEKLLNITAQVRAEGIYMDKNMSVDLSKIDTGKLNLDKINTSGWSLDQLEDYAKGLGDVGFDLIGENLASGQNSVQEVMK